MTKFSILSLLASLLVLASLAFGVPAEEMFHSDWQTVQLGIPFDTISTTRGLVSLTDKSTLAIQNAQNGDVIYRYLSEQAFDNTSRLLSLGEGRFVSVLNYKEESGSRVTFWTVDDTVLIDKEINFPRKTIQLTSVKGRVMTVDESGEVYGYDNFKASKVSEGYLDVIFTGAALDSTLDGTPVLFLKAENEQTYHAGKTLEKFKGCHLEDLFFVQGLSTYAVCSGSKMYEFDPAKNTIDLTKNKDVAGDILALSKAHPNLRPLGNFFVSEDKDNSSLYDIDISYTVPLSSIKIQKDLIFHKFFESDGGRTLSSLEVTPDLVVRFVSNGAPVWQRDESLAYIRDAIVLDETSVLPLSPRELSREDSSNPFVSYVHRVAHNIDVLKNWGSRVVDFNRHYGLTKTLVVVTESDEIVVFKTSAGNGTSRSPVGSFYSAAKLAKLYKVGGRVLGTDNELNFYDVNLEHETVTLADSEFIKANFRILEPANGPRRVIQTSSQDFYTLSVSNDKHSVTGYHVNNSTWSHNFEGEVLSYITRSYGNNRVASDAVTLADRRILYKYLVPNVAVFVTYDANALRIHLLDVVTGQVVVSFDKNTDNPEAVRVLFEENFILLATRAKDSVDTEITSIDLFESLTPDVKKSQGIRTFSSFGNTTIVPEYAMRTYIVPSLSVSQMALTSTKNNIALKQLVVTTDSGSVVAIPKAVLNGRRPVPENKKDRAREPMLFNYEPYVVVPDNLVLSHYRQLLGGNGLRKILSVPTELESTSVVISIDTDIFVTTVKPSASFDTLTASFNKRALVMTVSALIVGIFYTKPLSTSKKLKDLWRSS